MVRLSPTPTIMDMKHSDMQWKRTQYNPKEADIEIDMLCSFFRRKSCISLTIHYKDVVEDPLWQVHVNMLEVPS